MIFNEYGQANIPTEIYDAQRVYWKVIEPYLDALSIVECRALEMYLNIGPDLYRYIILRGIKERAIDKLKEV